VTPDRAPVPREAPPDPEWGTPVELVGPLAVVVEVLAVVGVWCLVAIDAGATWWERRTGRRS
jgi:hypothetical protein